MAPLWWAGETMQFPKKDSHVFTGLHWWKGRWAGSQQVCRHFCRHFCRTGLTSISARDSPEQGHPGQRMSCRNGKQQRWKNSSPKTERKIGSWFIRGRMKTDTGVSWKEKMRVYNRQCVVSAMNAVILAGYKSLLCHFGYLIMKRILCH